MLLFMENGSSIFQYSIGGEIHVIIFKIKQQYTLVIIIQRHKKQQQT